MSGREEWRPSRVLLWYPGRPEVEAKGWMLHGIDTDPERSGISGWEGALQLVDQETQTRRKSIDADPYSDRFVLRGENVLYPTREGKCSHSNYTRAFKKWVTLVDAYTPESTLERLGVDPFDNPNTIFKAHTVGLTIVELEDFKWVLRDLEIELPDWCEPPPPIPPTLESIMENVRLSLS